LPAASRALAEALPDARYIEVRRAAHAPFLSHTAEFASLVTGFLCSEPQVTAALATVAGKPVADPLTTGGATPAALASIAAKRRRSP
jgi:hypothetical protein